MKEADETAGGADRHTLEEWFGTVARNFPAGDLYLYTGELEFLFGARSRKKKGGAGDRTRKNKSILETLDRKYSDLVARSVQKILGGETFSFIAADRDRRILIHLLPLLNRSAGKMYILLHALRIADLKGYDLAADPRVEGTGRPGEKAVAAGGVKTPVDSLFEATPLPMFFADESGRIIGGNRNFRELLGCGDVDVTGLTVYDVVPEDLPGGWHNCLREVMEKGRGKWRLQLKFRDSRIGEADVVFIKSSSSGRDVVCAVVGSDRGGVEGIDAFLHGEDNFRLLSENVPDLIAVLDLARTRAYVNPAYRNFINNPASLLTEDALGIVHPDDREKVNVVLREGMSSGREQRLEFRIVTQDGGTRYVEAGGRASRDINGNLKEAIIVCRDVTERKKMEEQYFRNQRIESLGTLASGISHDLNNVLTPVILGVEALKRVQMDDRGRAIISSIGSSLSRGRDIVKQVLTFARGVEGGTMLIQPRHILKEAVALMKETFPKSIAFVENFPKSLWLLYGDATRIDQMIMNLGVNARDAMPDGGIIYVSADNVMIDEQFAAMKEGAKSGPYVSITMQDTGLGMSNEVRDHIFEPFYTTKASGKGTGLGLSIVHTIVKSHDGFIVVESEPGKGTTFRIYLPAVEVSEMEKPATADPKLLSGDGELLLVVDDEVSVCQITKQTLEAFGYRALTANDGTEAVALFAKHRDQISVVIMDVAMPVMDGPRTIRALRKLRPDVKIVVSSGVVAEDQLDLAGAATPNAFLPKPYTSERLLRTLRSVIEKK